MKKKTSRSLLAVIGATALVLLLGACEWFIVIIAGLENTTDFTVVLEWDEESEPLNLYATAPDHLAGIVTNSDIRAYTDIGEAFNRGISTTYTGFYPEDVADRVTVDSGNPSDGFGNSIRYTSPTSTSRAIEVTDLPVEWTGSIPGTNTTSPSSANGLLSAYSASDNLAALGIIEIYVLADSGEIRDSGDPVLTIYDANDRFLASFSLDDDAGIRGMSVVRIMFFRDQSGDNYYQYLIDKRNILNEGDVRSIGSDDQYVMLSSRGQER